MDQASNAPLATDKSFRKPTTPASSTRQAHVRPEVVVAGALAVDFSCDYAPIARNAEHIEPLPHTSNPAIINQSLGGVAHNIAKAAHLLGADVQFCSAVGDDFSGRAAVKQLESEGISVEDIHIRPAPSRTAQYVAINNANRDLALAMADMSILETIPEDTISEEAGFIFYGSHYCPKVLVVDANWSATNLQHWLDAAHMCPLTTTIFEPVSTAKVVRIFGPTSLSMTTVSETHGAIPSVLADVITPNTYELAALHDYANQATYFEHPAWFNVIDALEIPLSGLRVPLAVATSSDIVDQGIPQQAIKLLPFFPTILTKLGPQGVLMVKMLDADASELHDDAERKYILARSTPRHKAVGGLYVRLFPPERVLAPEEVVSVNGIGDTFCGALAVGIAGGARVQDVIDFAQRAASLSLQSKESVNPWLVTLREEAEKLCVSEEED